MWRSLLVTLMLVSAMDLDSRASANDMICGKKWYCEMTKDGDGNIHDPEKGTENDLMQFSCDGNFFLTDHGVSLKGNWLFDSVTLTITLVQQQLTSIPEKISYHIIDQDETHLVIIGQEGSGDNATTAYLYTK